MSISSELRLQVRQRADYACEFCGVTEVDTGGELTLDHYQPQARGGSDDADNLIYSCSRCNLYKADYWATASEQTPLWNPRNESASQHFIEAEDGLLYPLTVVGAFTLQRLRLNRPQLVQKRYKTAESAKQRQLFQRYSELLEALNQLNIQMSSVVQEQQVLLKEQRDLLRLLLKHKQG